MLSKGSTDQAGIREISCERADCRVLGGGQARACHDLHAHPREPIKSSARATAREIGGGYPRFDAIRAFSGAPCSRCRRGAFDDGLDAIYR